MNIKNIHSSIIEIFDKSGFKKKDISNEIIFLVALKVITNKKGLDINDISNLKNIVLNDTNLSKYFDIDSIFKLNDIELKIIIDTLNKNVIYLNDEELFNNFSTLIDQIHSISNPKHAQFYTNKSMANLVSELLLKDVNIDELNTQDEISIYEPASGTGNLIFTLLDVIKNKGINLDKIKVYANEFDSQVAFIFEFLLSLKNIKNEIKIGNTLTNYFLENNELKKFDFVISNPPFGLPYDQDELSNHKIYDSYKVKNKLKISPASDSLLVFLEIIRKSYSKAAIVIGSNSINQFNKYFDTNTKEYNNSVLGNIIKDKQLNFIIEQPDSMFFNTNISSVILKLSNNNETFNYINIKTEKQYINATKQPRNSKIKKEYSDENISNILNNKNPFEYNNNSKINELYENCYKVDDSAISDFINSCSSGLLGLKIATDLRLISLLNKNFLNPFYNHISDKLNIDKEYLISFFENNYELSVPFIEKNISYLKNILNYNIKNKLDISMILNINNKEYKINSYIIKDELDRNIIKEAYQFISNFKNHSI